MIDVLAVTKNMTFLQLLGKAWAGNGWGSCQAVLVGIWMWHVCGGYITMISKPHVASILPAALDPNLHLSIDSTVFCGEDQVTFPQSWAVQ